MTGVSGAAACERLASTRVESLDDSDLLEVIAEWDRVASWVASRQLEAMAEFARRPARVETAGSDPGAARAADAPLGDWVREFADDEIAARLRVSRLAASVRVTLGCRLSRHPATAAALREGRIDVARARIVADEVAVLDPVTAREVESVVFDRDVPDSAARLRARVQRAVIAADPVVASTRGERARAKRVFWTSPAADGMATLVANLAAVDAATIDAAVTAAARTMKANRGPGDRRSMDQLRADALVAPFARALDTGVLDGATSTTLARHRGERAAVRVTVAASTLLGHDDAPAQLDGYGPITAAVARELAPDARWRRLLTDPRSGTVLDVGTTTYRPPADLVRHVQARDLTCRYPGCGWPAQACDLDHVVPFPDGPTGAANLTALCRRHHRLKHGGGVEVERTDDDETLGWTMPTGHSYRVGPATPTDPGSTTRGPPPRSPD